MDEEYMSPEVLSPPPPVPPKDRKYQKLFGIRYPDGSDWASNYEESEYTRFSRSPKDLYQQFEIVQYMKNPSKFQSWYPRPASSVYSGQTSLAPSSTFQNDTKITTNSLSPLCQREVPVSKEISNLQTVFLGIISVMLISIIALDSTVIPASMPQIIVALNSSNGFTWIGTAYLLSSAPMMSVSGRLADIYGHKPLMLASLTLFIAGSAIAGAAQSMTIVVIARVIQGFGGGGLPGLVDIMIVEQVPVKMRGIFRAMNEGIWLVVSCLGPLIGGLLTSHGSWRWSFLINVPICGLVWFLVLFVLKFEKKTHAGHVKSFLKIDFLGIFACEGATILLLLALAWGGEKYNWKSPVVISFICTGLILYCLFIFIEASLAQEPLIPTQIMLTRSKASALSMSFLNSIQFMGVMYFLPFLFQSVYGSSPLVAALYTIPLAVCIGISRILVAIIINRVGRFVDVMRLGAGAVVAAIGLLSTMSQTAGNAKRYGYPAVYGIAVGLSYQTASISRLCDHKDAMPANATISFINKIGHSLGIAIVGTVFQAKLRSTLGEMEDPYLNELLATAAPVAINKIPTVSLPRQLIARFLYWKSFQITFYILIGIAGASFIFTLFTNAQRIKVGNENRANSISATEDEKAPPISQQRERNGEPIFLEKYEGGFKERFEIESKKNQAFEGSDKLMF